jgi:hypothetical protein
MLPPGITTGFNEYGWPLNLLLKGVGYTARKYGAWKAGRSRALEDRILDYINTTHGTTGSGVIWADVIIKPIIQDVPFGIALPPNLKGLANLMSKLRRFPHEARHRWRVLRRYVPEKKFNKILLKLVRERRIALDLPSQRYHRV